MKFLRRQWTCNYMLKVMSKNTSIETNLKSILSVVTSTEIFCRVGKSRGKNKVYIIVTFSFLFFTEKATSLAIICLLYISNFLNKWIKLSLKQMFTDLHSTNDWTEIIQKKQTWSFLFFAAKHKIIVEGFTQQILCKTTILTFGISYKRLYQLILVWLESLG